LKKVLDTAAFHFATGFGTGFSPVTPGTFGSMVGLLFLWLFFPTGLPGQLLYLAVITLLAVWSAGWLAEAEGEKDPGKIVSDEIAGQAFTFLLVSPAAMQDWRVLLAGFVLFRLFDIIKPPPIRRLENLPGGWGIVMDDVLAGVFANITLQIGLWVF
jgi:phosphatidylglycerophosphatase A